MSANAYEAVRTAVAAEQLEVVPPLQQRSAFTQQAFIEACCTNELKPIPLRGWQRWNFPSKTLQARMLKENMYVEVLEREAAPHTIAIVFEGTSFSELRDWTANLRWFLRFVPGFEDQYIVAAREVAKEFHEMLFSNGTKYRVGSNGALLSSIGSQVRIVSTGHSLGAGLAQYFAYVFKQEPPSGRGPKVSEVFAFDPSPVTGWFSATDPPRTYNAEGLTVNRIFEHGEILAYIRLLTSRLAITTNNPTIWEYRYNLDRDANIIRSHSMRRLVCGMVKTVKPWKSTQEVNRPQ